MLIIICHPSQNPLAAFVSKDNKVNEGVEPALSIGQTTIPFQVFFNIIAPAFGEKATKQDIMACLKRAHWVVNLKQATYVRFADGRKESDVPLIRHEDGETEFISEDGKKLIGKMRAGDRTPPEDWLTRRQWSHDLLTMVLEKGLTPERTTVTHYQSIVSGKKRNAREKASSATIGPQMPHCPATIQHG